MCNFRHNLKLQLFYLAVAETNNKTMAHNLFCCFLIFFKQYSSITSITLISVNFVMVYVRVYKHQSDIIVYLCSVFGRRKRKINRPQHFCYTSFRLLCMSLALILPMVFFFFLLLFNSILNGFLL